jgi:hypothetical protein
MADRLFHIIDGAQVILRSRGVFYQRELYYQGDRLFAKHGGGFVRIGEGEATSAPTVSWEHMDLPDHLKNKVVVAKFTYPKFNL